MNSLGQAAVVAYRRRGEGTPVVLVHGIPGGSGVWDDVEAQLPAGLDVIVPDLVGFGASTAPPLLATETLGPAAQAAALVGLLDRLEVTKAVLVGHDFGAPVCALLAASRPDLAAGVFLLAGNTFPDTPVPFPLSLTTVPVVGGPGCRLLFSTPSLRFMLRHGTGPGCPPPDAATYLGPRQQRRVIATIFAGALRRLAELYTPVEHALGAIAGPVAVGWGDHDPFFPLEQGRRTAAAAGAHLHIYEGAGHFLPHERPVQLAAHIEKLVAELR